MKLAINYSPQAAELVQAGLIQLDLFKCPDWHDLVSDAQAIKPVYIHFPISIGHIPISMLNLREIEAWLNQTETLYINTHLDAHSDFFGTTTVSESQVLEASIRELEQLTRAFGPERIILENIPFRAEHAEKGHIAHSVNPHLIRTVIESVNCGLLLDISHAVLACEYLNHDFTDYIHTLPMNRLRELHVTGIEELNGRRVDHLPLHEEDWQRLEWAIEQINTGRWAEPYIMAFEYGGIGPLFEWRSRSDVIATQVPRLYALAHVTEMAL